MTKQAKLIPTEKRKEIYEKYNLHFCTNCEGFFDVSMFNKNKSASNGLANHCTKCTRARHKENYSQGVVSYDCRKLKKKFPIPIRIGSAIKHIAPLKKELEQHPSPLPILMQKDPRTVKNYYEQLAKVKLAYVDIKWIMDYLQKALHG